MSTASTWNEWSPYVLVNEFPDAQFVAVKLPPSTLHLSVIPPVAPSVQVNTPLDAKCGFGGLVTSVGVGGGVPWQVPFAGQLMMRLPMLGAVYPSLVPLPLIVVV